MNEQHHESITRSDQIVIDVDGQELSVAADISLAAAMLNAGIVAFRRSVSGEPRAPLCGMGVCFECRVKIDGEPHIRACMHGVRPGMKVETDG